MVRVNETATVVIDRVETKDNGWYDLFDGNGNKYATKKAAIVEPARRLVGERAVLTYTTKQNGVYMNHYLDKVEEAPKDNGDHPPLGTGEYITGQKPPIEVRRIAAATAWKCAAEMARADLGFEAAQNLANKIFYDILKKGKAIEDEDIPF